MSSSLQELLNSPAMSPPPGVQPNFVDPPDLSNIYYAVIITSLTLSTLYSQNPDATYYNALFGLWTFPEITFGIIACCLPTAPKFIQTLRKAGTDAKAGSQSYLSPVYKSHRRDTDQTRAKTSTGSADSHDFKSPPKGYLPLGENHELSGVSKYDLGRSDAHIVRTVHTATVAEPLEAACRQVAGHKGQQYSMRLDSELPYLIVPTNSFLQALLTRQA
ncbi:MAG: hypothetical protein Q9218_004119 [Villophora microphyllina]